MQIGTAVQAVEQVTEQDFAGEPLHVHAEPGDAGRVVGLESDPQALPLLIRWERTGTVSGCDPSELIAAPALAAG